MRNFCTINLSIFGSAIPNNFNQLPPVALVEHGVDRHMILFSQTPSEDCYIVVGVIAYAQPCTCSSTVSSAAGSDGDDPYQ